jgi:hypothetical protein
MLTGLRKLICSSLALSIVVAPALRAQQTNTSAPIPSQIAAAHTIFVSNGGGSNYFNIFTGGPDRAYNSLYADLQQWNRYQFAASPAEADLIFEIRSIAPAVGDATDNTVTYNPQLVLRILDPKSNAVLWTTSANVRAIGTKKRRDRQFDQSLDVLVDKVAQLTGQQLTPTQLKAVDSNSRLPTAAKVFIGVGIAGLVGLTTYGIYRVTHPPALPPLTLPPFPATR